MRKTILFLFAVISILSISSCVGELNVGNQNTISFNTNGGSGIADVIVDNGTTFGSLNIINPSRDEDSFLGWFLDSNSTTAICDDYEINENITLYAK